MSRWFRSEHMEYISLIVNEDAAHDCLADLGKLSAIQFTDVSLHDDNYGDVVHCFFYGCGWVVSAEIGGDAAAAALIFIAC